MGLEMVYWLWGVLLAGLGVDGVPLEEWVESAASLSVAGAGFWAGREQGGEVGGW